MLPPAVTLEDLRYVYDPQMHATMLRDAPRNRFYAACLKNHRKDIEGNVVVDIGAGSGVLAALAVRYGKAGHVHAVEAMPEVARNIPEVLKSALSVEEDSERRITVHSGLIQSICQNPPLGWPKKVAVLVSEWFGMMGLSEGIALPLVQCRDCFVPTPHMIPGRLSVWIQAAMAPPRKGSHFQCGPALANVDSLVGKPHLLLDVDLQHCTNEDMFEAVTQRLSAVRHRDNMGNDSKRTENSVCGLLGWFDLYCCSEHHDTVLQTGPTALDTHWHQTWLPFEEPVLLPADFDVCMRVIHDQRWSDGMPVLAVDVKHVVSSCGGGMDARFLLECGRCLYDTGLDVEPLCKRRKPSDPEPRMGETCLAAEVPYSQSDIAEICKLAKQVVSDGPSELRERKTNLWIEYIR